MLIQWFPGHMAKTKRLITEHLKAVDLVAELLDARIPQSSANPMISELTAGKPRVVILNKADLADPEATKRWTAYYRAKGLQAIPLDSTKPQSKKVLIRAIHETAQPVIQKWLRKGLRNRPVRLMILGIPNVGKSTLINGSPGRRPPVRPIRRGIPGASSGCASRTAWICWTRRGCCGRNLRTRRRPCGSQRREPSRGMCLTPMRSCRRS